MHQLLSGALTMGWRTLLKSMRSKRWNIFFSQNAEGSPILSVLGKVYVLANRCEVDGYGRMVPGTLCIASASNACCAQQPCLRARTRYMLLLRFLLHAIHAIELLTRLTQLVLDAGHPLAQCCSPSGAQASSNLIECASCRHLVHFRFYYECIRLVARSIQC